MTPGHRFPGETARAGPRAGFALPAALFVLVAVSLVLLGHSLRSRAEREIAWNAGRHVRARMAARAGVAHALVHLRALQRAPHTPGREALARARWNRLQDEAAHLAATMEGGAAYRVTLVDGSAKLPLNHADEDELRALFIAVGASSDEADVAAQSVLDWRDADDLHRGRGAEWDDYYRTRSPAVRPRNGPFASVAELRRVRGLEALYGAVAELVSVGGQPRVNVNTAPAPVLRALPGFSDEAVRVILAGRAKGRFLGNLLELEPLVPASAWAEIQRSYFRLVQRAAFDPWSIEITCRGWVRESSMSSTSTAEVVRLGNDIRVVARVER